MKRIILTVLAAIIGVSLFAQNKIPERPDPPTLVTDYANMFSKAERAKLERKLVDFFAQTSNQIAVVTVNDFEGYDKVDFATRLAHKWEIGKKEFDNGILVLIKPKTSQSDGQVQIAVGYGLEAVVPDATTKQIVENEMIPSFKAGDMYGGVDKATTVLMGLAKGEYNYQQYAKKVSAGGFNPFILFIILFFVFPILFGRRKRGMYSAGGRRSSLPFWLAMGMMSGGHRSGGMFNDFSSGSGSFGGGGSSFGSFGGFGGGGFGGGGAGGSW